MLNNDELPVIEKRKYKVMLIVFGMSHSPQRCFYAPQTFCSEYYALILRNTIELDRMGTLNSTKT